MTHLLAEAGMALEAAAPGETAQRWRYRDGGGEIGVISSVTQAFCRDCNRARLSTEGKLYLCAIKDVHSNRIVGYSAGSICDQSE